jgi:hypothetical protein
MINTVKEYNGWKLKKGYKNRDNIHVNESQDTGNIKQFINKTRPTFYDNHNSVTFDFKRTVERYKPKGYTRYPKALFCIP